ncbi:hypothetical protein D022_3787B, partial [Vibrio parahaemolyticus 12310]
TPYT